VTQSSDTRKRAEAHPDNIPTIAQIKNHLSNVLKVNSFFKEVESKFKLSCF
jgi:hypothetical protein